MRALILAAGYGTRLQRDITEDRSGRFSSLLSLPKPLLPVGGVPLVSKWTKSLRSCAAIESIHLVTNARFANVFETWRRENDERSVEIVDDGTTSNETRLGAVADIKLALDRIGSPGEDIIVIGGDTLFYEDFNIGDLLKYYQRKKAEDENIGGVVLSYECTAEQTRKYGILDVDADGKVRTFLEKPGPEGTSSRRACPCFYLLSKVGIRLVGEFLLAKKADGASLVEMDAPGNFIRYLCNRASVWCMEISGRFDIGSLQSYVECNDYFSKHDT